MRVFILSGSECLDNENRYQNVDTVFPHVRPANINKAAPTRTASKSLSYPNLLQESFDDLLLGFLLVKTQGHELCDLLACDLADSSFVDERSVNACCLELRCCDDNALVHDDGIALRMALADGISGDVDDDILLGFTLCDAAAYDVAYRTVTVKIDLDLCLCRLVEVRKDLVVHDQGSVRADLCLCDPVCIVDPGDLGSVHVHCGAFFKINDRCRVHEPLAGACSLAVVLLDVLYLRILSDMESMDAVMLAVVSAAVADAAPCDDGYVTVGAYEKVVINALLVAGFADDYRDMAGFIFRSVLEIDVDAVS